MDWFVDTSVMVSRYQSIHRYQSIPLIQPRIEVHTIVQSWYKIQTKLLRTRRCGWRSGRWRRRRQRRRRLRRRGASHRGVSQSGVNFEIVEQDFCSGRCIEIIKNIFSVWEWNLDRRYRCHFWNLRGRFPTEGFPKAELASNSLKTQGLVLESTGPMSHRRVSQSGDLASNSLKHICWMKS